MSSKEQLHSRDKATLKQQSPQPTAKNFDPLIQQTHPAAIIRQARLDPGSLTPRDVLQLQRTIGNQAVKRLLAGTVQHQPANNGHNSAPVDTVQLQGEDELGQELIPQELTRMMQQNGGAVQQAQNPAKRAAIDDAPLYAPGVRPIPQTPTGGMIQQAKTKGTAVGAVGGAVVLGGTGAAIGTAVAPGVGTAIGAAIGSGIGALLGGIVGYFLSDSEPPKKYYNRLQAKYQEEKQEFELYQQEHQHEATAYARGAIIPYSKDRADEFHGLIQQGMVLYIVHENGQLVIGTPQHNKHAVVAGNQPVIAAGTAGYHMTLEEEDFLRYQDAVHDLERVQAKVEELTLQFDALNLPAKIPDYNQMKSKQKIEWLQQNGTESDVQLLHKLNNAHDELLFAQEEVKTRKEYAKNYQDKQSTDTSGTLEIDNNSGHYHPEKQIKSVAISTWQRVGYKNVKWTEHKAR